LLAAVLRCYGDETACGGEPHVCSLQKGKPSCRSYKALICGGGPQGQGLVLAAGLVWPVSAFFGDRYTQRGLFRIG